MNRIAITMAKLASLRRTVHTQLEQPRVARSWLTISRSLASKVILAWNDVAQRFELVEVVEYAIKNFGIVLRLHNIRKK